MPIRLSDLIARVPAEVEIAVKKTRDEVRSVVQEALRTECRLVLRTPEEALEQRAGAQVPVEVKPGHPAVLDRVVFSDELERVLLLSRYRVALERAKAGCAGLIELNRELARRPEPKAWIDADDEELKRISRWASRLLEHLDTHDPLKNVLAVDEDCLGVYEYDARAMFVNEFVANRAVIRLYWGVIGLVSEWSGWSVRDLTIVVLTHELAHAYTQLGADIEGRRWFAPAFAKAEHSLKEGLAQYYTERVLVRLERRYSGALEVFRRMLPSQPEAYRTHEPWIENLSAEAIRRAMLEVRRWQEGELVDFNRRAGEAHEGLSGSL